MPCEGNHVFRASGVCGGVATHVIVHRESVRYVCASKADEYVRWLLRRPRADYAVYPVGEWE